jgi:hypothetical protein
MSESKIWHVHKKIPENKNLKEKQYKSTYQFLLAL